MTYLEIYQKNVQTAYANGNTETLYNAPIQDLLKNFGVVAEDHSGSCKGKKGENIDLWLWRELDESTKTAPFSVLEIKKVGGIDDRAKEQVQTALKSYKTTILTDNLTWQFWRENDIDNKIEIYAGVRLLSEKDGKITLNSDKIDIFNALMNDFVLESPKNVKSSARLAKYMASYAQTIKEIVKGVLKEDDKKLPLINERQEKLPLFKGLMGLFSRIKKELRPQLTTSAFADMYAQTLVYGFFVARYNDTAAEPFTRDKAIRKLRDESLLLNKFFDHIEGEGENHPTLNKIIDQICGLFQICDISEILDNDKRNEQLKSDTIIHFYENFLAEYDAELRKKMGVFYTPPPVVAYIVQAVDKILVQDFNIENGLANNETMRATVPIEPRKLSEKNRKTKKSEKMIFSEDIAVPRVAILDPACGTGAFHAEILKYIANTYFAEGNRRFLSSELPTILSRMIGFEIMMTSYVVAHLNVRRTVEELSGKTARLPVKIYLSNTLSTPKNTLEKGEQIMLADFSGAISEEAYNADTWKTRRPLEVIIGNPPYLAASSNRFADVDHYKKEVDEITPLQERTLNSLQDDYVKFFRFAEQIIEKNGEGVLAFVSNNGFLDNHTFRGMRGSLLRTFDTIHIINLHGNAMKREKTPTGGKDENIFDIMVGVSLFVGAKRRKQAKVAENENSKDSKNWATVYYADIFGMREEKLAALQNVKFEKLTIDEKMAYFIPFGGADKDEYDKGISVAELFPVYNIGSETANDDVAIAFTQEEIIRRVNIVKYALEEQEILRLFGKYSSSQTAQKIQDDILSNEGIITKINYRPFDTRWTYYSGRSGGWMHRPAKATMGHLLNEPTTPIGQNIGLVFIKQEKSHYEFSKIFITDKIVDRDHINTVAPLYLYNQLDGTWQANISQIAAENLCANLPTPPTAIEIFDYVYGLLYSPKYRKMYNEYLKRDFPKVKIPQNFEEFEKYRMAGEKLRKLHLMQKKVKFPLDFTPTDTQNFTIERIKYKEGVLHINAKTGITGVPQAVWEYRLGGYQVLDKWLKSHKGEKMGFVEFGHFCEIVGALLETIAVQEGL
ncbi:MAG: N-6 DNA methylase [Firmicutes bacterium]|nr:N-6 DNA methylase [Bacillota bacterium]